MIGRILPRDYYLKDYTHKYYPVSDFSSFAFTVKSLFTDLRHLALYSKKEIIALDKQFKVAANYTGATAAASLLMILLYGWLPVLKNLNTWKLRLPISIGLLLAPVGMALHQEKKLDKMARLYYTQKKPAY